MHLVDHCLMWPSFFKLQCHISCHCKSRYHILLLYKSWDNQSSKRRNIGVKLPHPGTLQFFWITYLIFRYYLEDVKIKGNNILHYKELSTFVPKKELSTHNDFSTPLHVPNYAKQCLKSCQAYLVFFYNIFFSSYFLGKQKFLFCRQFRRGTYLTQVRSLGILQAILTLIINNGSLWAEIQPQNFVKVVQSCLLCQHSFAEFGF